MAHISKKILSLLLYFLLVDYAFCQALLTVQGESRVDFGEYPAKESKNHQFTIKNSGKSNLNIQALRMTCDCSEASISNKSIRPGKKAIITLKVKGNDLTGKYTHKIYIISNDPNNKIAELFFSGNAIPLCDVKPEKNLYVGTVKVGSKFNQLFTIIPRQNDVILGNPEIKAKFPLEAKISRKNNGYFILQLKSDNVVAKRNRFSIQVFVPIIKPKGWSPIEIHIKGRMANAADHHH